MGLPRRWGFPSPPLCLRRSGRPEECPVSSTFTSKKLNSAGVWLRGRGLLPHPALTHTMEAVPQGEHQEYGGPNLPWSSSLQGTGSTPGEASPESQGLPPARLPEEWLRDFAQEGKQSIKQELQSSPQRNWFYFIFWNREEEYSSLWSFWKQ